MQKLKKPVHGGTKGLETVIYSGTRDELQKLLKAKDDYIDDLNSVIESERKLTKELDAALSGYEYAAKQASLCDLIPVAIRIKRERDMYRIALENIQVVLNEGTSSKEWFRALKFTREALWR